MARVNQIALANAVQQAPSAPVQRSPYVEAMLQQNMRPVATPTEGFARMGQAALAAMDERRRQGQSDARQQAATEDMTYLAQAAQPWVNPDTGQQSQGGKEGIMAALQSGRLQSPEMRNMVAQTILGQALNPSAVKPPPTREIKVGGQVLTQEFNPQTGEWTQLGTSPQFKPDTLSQEALEQRRMLAREGAARSSVNVVNKRESKYHEERGKQEAGFMGQMLDAGRSASQSMTRINRMEQLLNGINTGSGADWRLNAGKLAEKLGLPVDVSGLGRQEAAAALAQEFAVEMLQKLKGSASDTEGERIIEGLPGLARTPEGNRLILDTMRQLSKRAIAEARRARAYEKKHGSISGFEDELAQWREKNPLFTDDLTRRIDKAMGVPNIRIGAPKQAGANASPDKWKGWKMEIVR